VAFMTMATEPAPGALTLGNKTISCWRRASQVTS